MTDILFDINSLFLITSIPQNQLPIFLIEFLRMNKQFNFFWICETGFFFFKISKNEKNGKFEITQKKQIAFRKILIASYDFRNEITGVVFENDPTFLKVFPFDDNFFKSQTHIHKIPLDLSKNIYYDSYFFDFSGTNYSTSIENRKKARNLNFENKIEVCTLYNCLFVLFCCPKKAKLTLFELGKNLSEKTFKIPEGGFLNRRC